MFSEKILEKFKGASGKNIPIDIIIAELRNDNPTADLSEMEAMSAMLSEDVRKRSLETWYKDNPDWPRI